MSNKVATVMANQIIKLISSGKLTSWKKGWVCNESGYMPFNGNSNRKYKGAMNIIALNIASGGRIPAFATKSADRKPKANAVGVKICSPRMFTKTDKVTGEETSECFGFRYLTVYHYTELTGMDVAGIEAKYPTDIEEENDFNSIGVCEAIVSDMPNVPEINHGGNQAFYRPSTDLIQMPEQTSFLSAGEYYHTLFHEMAHSTIHVTRLDRKQSREGLETNKHEYSFEELVAELTACTLSATSGTLNDEMKENSGAYMKSWIKPLQNNPEWIVKASGAANRAYSYIIGD